MSGLGLVCVGCWLRAQSAGLRVVRVGQDICTGLRAQSLDREGSEVVRWVRSFGTGRRV